MVGSWGSGQGGAELVKQVYIYLSDLFDFAATFTDKRTTLAGWHNNAQCDRRLWGCCTIWHGAAYVLKISQEELEAVVKLLHFQANRQQQLTSRTIFFILMCIYHPNAEQHHQIFLKCKYFFIPLCFAIIFSWLQVVII